MKNFIPENMPEPLFRQFITFVAIGIACVALAVIFSIIFKDVRNLVILLVALYFFYYAFYTIVFKWNTDKIITLEAYCAAVEDNRISQFTRNFSIVLTTNDPQFPSLTFNIARSGCKFAQGINYIIYLDSNNTARPLAYACLL